MSQCPRPHLLALVVPSTCAPLVRTAPRDAARARILVNGDAPAHPFPHLREQMFGSGRAILSLRADYRRDLRQIKRATALHLIRFHGIFDRGVGIIHLNAHAASTKQYRIPNRRHPGIESARYATVSSGAAAGWPAGLPGPLSAMR